jgi:hypothetical protein
LAAVFDEYQLVQNFIISWVNEGEEPAFLEDWQQSLHRGQNQRYRRPTPAPRDARPLNENGDSDQPLARIVSRRPYRSVSAAGVATRRTSALAPSSRRRVTVREPVSDSEGSKSLSKWKAKVSDQPLADITTRRTSVPRDGAHSDQPLTDVITRQTSALAPRRVMVREPASDSEGSKSSFPLSKRKSKAKPIPSDAEMTATDGEMLGRKKYPRRQPKANGNIHDPPCGHCQRRRLECLEDEYGGACVPCKKRKTGCTHSGVKGKRLSRKTDVGSETEREVAEPGRKKRRRVRKNTDTDAEGLGKVKSSKRRRVEVAATANQDDHLDEKEARKSRPVVRKSFIFNFVK